jgi:hypothetical protein
MIMIMEVIRVLQGQCECEWKFSNTPLFFRLLHYTTTDKLKSLKIEYKQFQATDTVVLHMTMSPFLLANKSKTFS